MGYSDERGLESDEELISKTYKNSYTITSRKEMTLKFFKWTKDPNRHFSKEDIEGSIGV
jgi:hypothetical protein